MNGILSVGTALGASLYNIIGEFVFINPEGKKLQSMTNFTNSKLPIILKNTLFKRSLDYSFDNNSRYFFQK